MTEKKTKKIAICGTAPSSMMLVPQGNPDWEIWSCSPGTYGFIKKIDRFYELHRWEPGQPWFSPEYCEFLRNFPNPVYMSAPVAGIKNLHILPAAELVQKYGPYFFTSSIAWMMAMAIEEGATSIGLFGVDMAASEEYGFQRAGCQYMALIAASKGIEVGVPPESDLFRPAPLYGLCETSHNFIKMTARKRELTDRLNRVAAENAGRRQEEDFIRGALDDMQWNEQTWHGNVDTLGQKFTSVPIVPALMTMSESIQVKQTITLLPKTKKAPAKKKTVKKKAIK